MNTIEYSARADVADEAAAVAAAVAALSQQMGRLEVQLEDLREQVEAARLAAAFAACREGGNQGHNFPMNGAGGSSVAPIVGVPTELVRKPLPTSTGQALGVRAAPDPFTVLEAVRYADQVFADALLFQDCVFASAAELPARYAQQVLCVFRALASVARRRSRGSLADPPAYELRALGLRCETVISTAEQVRTAAGAYPRRGEYLYERIIIEGSIDTAQTVWIHFLSRCGTDPRLVVSYIGMSYPHQADPDDSPENPRDSDSNLRGGTQLKESPENPGRFSILRDGSLGRTVVGTRTLGIGRNEGAPACFSHC